MDNQQIEVKGFTSTNTSSHGFIESLFPIPKTKHYQGSLK
jgi:hypothetical protein